MQRCQLELRLAPPLAPRRPIDPQPGDGQLAFARSGRWEGRRRGSRRAQGAAGDPRRLLHPQPLLGAVIGSDPRQLGKQGVDAGADQV
jgi:hypothetical protein